MSSPPMISPVTAPPSQEFTRPLYVRRVPERVWLMIHDNAHRSRMRLQDYMVKLMEHAEPFPLPSPPSPLPTSQSVT